jgi:hypothetical protein
LTNVYFHSYLNNNQLTELSVGLFEGLTKLQQLCVLLRARMCKF